MFDVHIVGAGPSGCFAAIHAQRRGLNVKISEEHPRIGAPTNCSGLVSATGLEELSDFVDFRKCALNSIRGANVHCGAMTSFSQGLGVRPGSQRLHGLAPTGARQFFPVAPESGQRAGGGRTMRIRTSSTIAYVIDRAHFDTLCASAAEKEGAKIITGERISGNFESDAIIGADGPASHVAAHFGFPKNSHFVSTYQGQFEYSCPDSDCVEVYLSEKFPGFFGWAIPQNESRALIGVGVRPPAQSKKAYDYLVNALGSPRELSCSGFTIPTSVRAKTAGQFGQKKVLLVGDAAGQVKATTGGGIYFGASCGRLAGELCNTPLEYEHEWRKRHYADLLLHRAVRRWLDTMPSPATELSFSIAKSLMLERFLSERGHMDRPSRMIGARQLATYAGILLSGALGRGAAPAAVRQ